MYSGERETSLSPVRNLFGCQKNNAKPKVLVSFLFRHYLAKITYAVHAHGILLRAVLCYTNGDVQTSREEFPLETLSPSLSQQAELCRWAGAASRLILAPSHWRRRTRRPGELALGMKVSVSLISVPLAPALAVLGFHA